MAVEITHFLALENLVEQQNFIANFKYSPIIELDQGHDRPVWEKRSGRQMALIPQSSETILIDGIVALVMFLLKHKKYFPEIAEQKREQKREYKKERIFVDLNKGDSSPISYENLSQELDGFAVVIILLRGSGLSKHEIELLDKYHIPYRVLAEIKSSQKKS